MKKYPYKYSLLTMPTVALVFINVIYAMTYYNAPSARASQYSEILVLTVILMILLFVMDMILQQFLQRKYPLEAKRILNTIGLVIMLSCYGYYKLVIAK